MYTHFLRISEKFQRKLIIAVDTSTTTRRTTLPVQTARLENLVQSVHKGYWSLLLKGMQNLMDDNRTESLWMLLVGSWLAGLAGSK